MAQKLFFRKRRRVPEQIQIFFILILLIFVFAPLAYFWGFIPVENNLPSPKNIVVQNSSAVTLTNRWLRLQPQFREDIFTVENLFQRYGKVDSWESAVIANTKPEQKCFDMVYSKMSSVSDSALVFLFPASDNKQDDYAYALFSGFSFMETFAHENMKQENYSLFVIFSPINNPACTASETLVKKIEKDFSVKANLIFSPAANDKEYFSVTGLRANTSNPKWFSLLESNMLPDEKNKTRQKFSQEKAQEIYKSFANQWLSSSFAFLEGKAGSALSSFVPALAWYYPARQDTFSSAIANGYTKKFLHIAEYFQNTENSLNNTAFFVKDFGMLKPFYFWLVVVLGLLFIWFHFINFVYFHEEGIEPVRGILSLFYFSLVPIAAYAGLEIGNSFGFQNQMFTFLVLFLALLLYFFLKKIDDKFISAHANSLTSLLFFYLLLTVLVWKNPVLFLSFVPVGIFLARVKDSNWFGAFFLLLFGFAIPLFLLYLLLYAYPNVPLFRADFITKEIFTSWTDFLPFAFSGGSLISLISRND